MNNSKIDLIEIVTILSARKKYIVIGIVVSIVIGVTLALVWPKSYKADISFIVTDGNAINFSTGGVLSGLANLSLNGSRVSSDQALVLIRSKDIQNKVIEKFNLNDVYGTNIPEALRRKLNNNILIEEVREGGIGFSQIISISLSYVDEDPERAFELVQYYYKLVDEKITKLNRKNTEGGYLLLQNRLNQNEKDLAVAEDSLVSFQSRYGILEVEEQAKAQIEAIAELKTELVRIEIQEEYLKEVFGDDNSTLKNLQVRKSKVDQQYQKLIEGSETQDDLLVSSTSVAEMPEIFLEYLRRFREVKVQEEIYKVLYPQYEQQKLNYEEINSGLLVIDPSLLPTYKYKPKRAFIVLAVLLFGMFFVFTIVFIQEWKKHLEQNESDKNQRVEKFISSLKKW